MIEYLIQVLNSLILVCLEIWVNIYIFSRTLFKLQLKNDPLNELIYCYYSKPIRSFVKCWKIYKWLIVQFLKEAHTKKL